MPFCEECGKPISEEAVFCSYCGQRATVLQIKGPMNANVEEASNARVGALKSNGPWVKPVICICMLALFLAGFYLFEVIQSKTKENEKIAQEGKMLTTFESELNSICRATLKDLESDRFYNMSARELEIVRDPMIAETKSRLSRAKKRAQQVTTAVQQIKLFNATTAKGKKEKSRVTELAEISENFADRVVNYYAIELELDLIVEHYLNNFFYYSQRGITGNAPGAEIVDQLKEVRKEVRKLSEKVK